MKKILIIDDDPDLVSSTTAVLESKGYSVASAPNGKEGYEQARKLKPDLVLLDVMMAHDTEGFEVAKKFRQDPATANLPVIILTGIRKAKGLPFGYEPDEDWLPVQAVLEKPVKPEVLLSQVEDALGKTVKK
jgi:CheY-like chemotaxis protein